MVVLPATRQENMENVSDHSRMEVLSSEECYRLLAEVPVGRIAYVADGGPRIFPVTFALHGSHIVFRSARGSKLDAAEMRRRVAFEADHWDPGSRSGWSVVVQGRTRDAAEPTVLDELDFEPWLAGDEMSWIEIIPEEISGRRLPG